MKGSADGGGCFPTGRHYPGIAHLLRVMAAGLVAELAGDTPLAELPLVAIDTETTGKDPAEDRIVEVACVFRRGGTITDQKSWLLNPGRPIPEEAARVHGIQDADVRDAPCFGDIAPELLEALREHVPVAYNADFDRKFLLAEFTRQGLLTGTLPPALRRDVVWIDPLVWARELQKDKASRALGDVCERLGIEIGQAHRATDDAAATLRVLAAFEPEATVPKSYVAFIQEQQRLARRADEQRRAWRSRPN